MNKAYYCKICHSITENVQPEYQPDQERKYLEMLKEHCENPTTSTIVMQRQFSIENTNHWNYTMTCPVCDGVHRYWQGEE